MTELDKALDALTGIRIQDLRSEVDNLRAVRDWAVQQLRLDYRPGDEVVIVSDRPSSTKAGSGWYPFRMELAEGQTGIAGDVFFNASHAKWQVEVAIECGNGRSVFFMDVLWVEKSPSGVRYAPGGCKA
jgi:hypothetical protein